MRINFIILSKFVASGVIGATVDLLLLYLFTDLLGWWYLASAIFAYILALAVGFILQKFWTFQQKNVDCWHRQAIAYYFLGIINLGFNTALMYVSVDLLGLWYLPAQGLVTAIIALGSFLIYQHLIFKV